MIHALHASGLAAALAILSAAPMPEPDRGARFGAPFAEQWYDGQAEVSTYALVLPRYGELRQGTAIAVFVTEPFSRERLVKSDAGRGPGVGPAMKLNLLQRFQTGVYDYHMMLSAFSALDATPPFAPAALLKLSFSVQEWCGQVHHEVRFREDALESEVHSYFEGESGRRELDLPADGFGEDALLLWARGFAGPELLPGQSRTVPLLRSLETCRLRHLPVEWQEARLSRAAEARTVRVPAGEFEVEAYSAEVEGGATWSILVEAAPPRRIVRWSADDGRVAELVGSRRMPYWQRQGDADESLLPSLGLAPVPLAGQ